MLKRNQSQLVTESYHQSPPPPPEKRMTCENANFHVHKRGRPVKMPILLAFEAQNTSGPPQKNLFLQCFPSRNSNTDRNMPQAKRGATKASLWSHFTKRSKVKTLYYIVFVCAQTENTTFGTTKRITKWKPQNINFYSAPLPWFLLFASPSEMPILLALPTLPQKKWSAFLFVNWAHPFFWRNESQCDSKTCSAPKCLIL